MQVQTQIFRQDQVVLEQVSMIAMSETLILPEISHNSKEVDHHRQRCNIHVVIRDRDLGNMHTKGIIEPVKCRVIARGKITNRVQQFQTVHLDEYFRNVYPLPVGDVVFKGICKDTEGLREIIFQPSGRSSENGQDDCRR